MDSQKTIDINPDKLLIELKDKAESLGFEGLGAAPIKQFPDLLKNLKSLIDKGGCGDMDWLAREPEKRANPQILWPGVKSVVALAMNYGTGQNPLTALNHKSNGVIATYAKGKDYHTVIKKRLRQLARFLVEETGCTLKIFVDTAPVMEKPLAQLAGLGWQGKHTNLVIRDLGSWAFLAIILTDLELPSNPPHQDHCGTCTSCIDICPTKAIIAPYKIDPRLCISYLTIEHKGPIDRKLRPLMGNHIFGCDDCLAICPWNKFAKAHEIEPFAQRDATDNPPLNVLLKLTEEQFRKAFAGTAIKRTGRDRFIRNCLIAAGNSGDESLVEPICALLNDQSALVRTHAVWAIAQLMGRDEFDLLKKKHLSDEADKMVLDEWNANQE